MSQGKGEFNLERWNATLWMYGCYVDGQFAQHVSLSLVHGLITNEQASAGRILGRAHPRLVSGGH